MPTTDMKRKVPDAVLGAVGTSPNATAAELSAITGLGRSTVSKALVTLEAAGKVTRTPGGRDAGRRQADRWFLAGAPAAPGPGAKTAAPKRKRAPAKGKPGRLGRGALRDLALEHLRAQGEPVSPSHVAAALGHSAGAIGNAMERLVTFGLAERVSDRRYRAVRTKGAGR